MNISSISNQYSIRKLSADDVAEVYELCSGNPLYYQYCPPFVSRESIVQDMNALPPHKNMSDKYYLGFFDGEKLVAIMDLILAYPDRSTAWIGFFMTDRSIQNTGVGSRMISELCSALKAIGFSFVSLGWVQGNPQAEHFWQKNGFLETGNRNQTDSYTIVFAQRML